LSLPAADDDAGQRSPTRATPISLCARADLEWLLLAGRGPARPTEPERGALAEIVEALRRHGARFHRELAADTARLASDIERALWDGVARGLLTADGFHAVRSLLQARQANALVAAESPLRRRRSLRRGATGGRAPGEGRWALVPEPATVDEPDELAEAVAEQLLSRWGVVFRDLAQREHLALPWREVQWALRRLEARGVIRGGRFVHGFSGEQYATPEAVDLLRAVRRSPPDGEAVVLSAADPLNVTGIVLPGERIPALGNRTVTWRDGLPAECSTL
jgi:ATP-dependent Lhr-like helicase